jgi:hypothetical protein
MRDLAVFFTIVACVAVVVVVGATIGAVVSFCDILNISLSVLFRSDISENCFDNRTYSVFVAWMALCSVGTLALVLVRAWHFSTEHKLSVGLRILNVFCIIFGCLSVCCLNILCPIALVSDDAHFLVSMGAIGFLYLYGIFQVVLFGLSLRLPSARLPRWFNVVCIVYWSGCVVAGVVCAVVWAISELHYPPLSGLEWTTVFLLFVYFGPIVIILFFRLFNQRRVAYSQIE